MKNLSGIAAEASLAPFDRSFFDPLHRFKYIGSGSLGGKAQGLAFIQRTLTSAFPHDKFPFMEVSIPSLTVLRTDIFDSFLERNRLDEVAYSDSSDDFLAYAFQKAELPAEILGDLRAMVEQVRSPLAIRSSSLLEDAIHEPFAGIYTTKMIPNNQQSADERFRKLSDAVKLVYASTFFKAAKDYARAAHQDIRREKMAVIVQEVVGQLFNGRYYPQLSGVARSFNFYSMGRSKPEDGVVSLALGLGKTIVDGDRVWTYSPAYPKVAPPFGSAEALLKETQTEFWAVNMGKPPAYDPIRETEYLVKGTLSDAELDETLRHSASTYDPISRKISIGIGTKGPRVITFAPLLDSNETPVNAVIRTLLSLCAHAMGSPVEIEFAMTFNPNRFGFLQVRPMVVSREQVDVHADEMKEVEALLASEQALGNGLVETIRDIVYVKPSSFDAKFTRRIAAELENFNRTLANEGRPYLLIGFGRWGSSDPWLGIPVQWGQIGGVKVMVEAVLPNMNVDLSQGSHFFHNLTSFQVKYFCIPYEGEYPIKWELLEQHQTVHETEFVRQVRLPFPLLVKVDGRSGRGVILMPSHG